MFSEKSPSFDASVRRPGGQKRAASGGMCLNQSERRDCHKENAETHEDDGKRSLADF